MRYDATFSLGCNCGYANFTLRNPTTFDFVTCCTHIPNPAVCFHAESYLSYPDRIPIEGKFNNTIPGLRK